MSRQTINLQNSDGKNISGVINFPKTKTERLAILCPGFLDTKDYTHLVKLAEALAEKGYTVVRFDPTGTWESDGDISDYSTTQYLKDVKSVLEYMLGVSNYKYILIGGHSRGGMVSILYAASDPRISAVLGIMPSNAESHKNREEWKRTGLRTSRREIPGKSETMEFRVPYSHSLDRDKYHVLEDVKKIHAPIIFIAGEKDAVVPPEEVRKIFDAANEPKKYILLKGIGHDYRHNISEIEMVNAKILETLDLI